MAHKGHLSTAAGLNERKRPLVGNVKVYEYYNIYNSNIYFSAEKRRQHGR